MADEEVFSNEELQDYLRTYVMKNTKMTSPKFHITRASKEGDNYVGLVYRVTIEGTENGEAKSVVVILKTRRFNKMWDDATNQFTNLFQREIYFYQTILPIFQKIVKEHGKIVDCSPSLYCARSEVGKEILILENLNPKGYVMKSAIQLDYPHASLALKKLGEFHSYSFLTRVADPTSFEKLKVEELFLKKEPPSEKMSFFRDLVINVAIKALADEDKHYTERLQRFIDNLTNEMADAVDGKQAEPYAILIHGDFWTNNMLFKYDQEGKPCDIRFIDFQVCRYASPVIDLVYTFFCCCAPETRSKYYDRLLHDYHEALSKSLESFGYDPNDFFPYEVLSEHLMKFGKFGAGMALFCLPIFYNDSDDKSLETAYTKEALEERLETSSFFRNNIKRAFKDIIDKNYI